MNTYGSATPEARQPLLTIRRIAKMLQVHPQTLRLYERHGFITPARSKGNTRLYSEHDIEQIRAILHLTRDHGVNLAGVDIILDMRQKIAAIQRDIVTLRQHLAPPPDSIPTQTRYQRALVKIGSRTLIRVPPAHQ